MAKKTTTKREGIRCKTRMMHVFNSDEFRQRALEANKLERDRQLMIEDLKVANATSKAQIKHMGAQAAMLRNNMDDGGEMVEVDAIVTHDRKAGVKTYYRFCPDNPDHDSKIRTENMTDDDYQKLPIDEVDDEPRVQAG